MIFSDNLPIGIICKCMEKSNNPIFNIFVQASNSSQSWAFDALRHSAALFRHPRLSHLCHYSTLLLNILRRSWVVLDQQIINLPVIMYVVRKGSYFCWTQRGQVCRPGHLFACHCWLMSLPKMCLLVIKKYIVYLTTDLTFGMSN